MGSVADKMERKYTYEDYQAWPNEERWEIIDGEAYNMSPAPTVRHQRIVRKLISILDRFFAKGPYEPFGAPIDVVLDTYNIVQPDIVVVCDKEKITEANIQGTPDLVIEIVSPRTRLKDRREKKMLYERFGVREYLIFYPEDEMAESHRLVDGQYQSPVIFNRDETITLSAFPDLSIDLGDIFVRELSEKK